MGMQMYATVHIVILRDFSSMIMHWCHRMTPVFKGKISNLPWLCTASGMLQVVCAAQ